MGRKKKKKIPRRAEKPTVTAPGSAANKTAGPEPPNLVGMSDEWREFYKLIIKQLS